MSPKQTQLIVEEMEHILRALRSGIPQEWFTLELTMPQLRALFALREEGRSRMGTLAALLGMSLSGATGLMDRLLEKGLVERAVDPDDRRSVRHARADRTRRTRPPAGAPCPPQRTFSARPSSRAPRTR